jgi:amidase
MITQEVEPSTSARDWPASFRVEAATISEIQAHLSTGQLCARELLELHLERITAFDKRGPCINAVIELNPDAAAIADTLDHEFAATGRLRPLHGVPVLLKDNINTADRMNTTAGSHLLLGSVARQDATVVKRLREAGAVLIGKANMDEFATANGLPSGRGGVVRNPYDPTRDANGSSSGSAAGVAAGFACVALGTDTCSSLRFPAADCSLVALKPTSGLVSRAGVMPGSATIDVVGPLARNVTDLALLLGTLTGYDPLDTVTSESEDQSFTDYTRFLRHGDLSGVRIGVARKGFCGVTADVDLAFENAIEVLKLLGAEIVDPVVLRKISFGGFSKDVKQLLETLDEQASVEYFKSLHPDSPFTSFEQFYYFVLTAQFPTLVDLKGMFRGVSPQEISSLNGAGSDRAKKQHEARQRFFSEQQKLILSVMDGNKLDGVVFPTKSKLAAPILPDETYPAGDAGIPHLASYSGFPELTVPAGYSRSGLPIGISFLGRAFSEPVLLRLGFAYEQATKHRRCPDLSARKMRTPGEIPPVPQNDNFAASITLEGSSSVVHGNNFRAGVERGEPRHGTGKFIDRTVWYDWTAPESGWVKFDTAESYPARHYVAIYTGESLQELQEVACNNYPEKEMESPDSVRFKAVKDTTYRIAVGSNPQLVALGKVVLKWHLAAPRIV